MQEEKADRRFYRAFMGREGLVRFRVRHLETDLHIQAVRDLSRKCSARIIDARTGIETYASKHPGFLETYTPLPGDEFAPCVVREMLDAARIANTGPMAAVAGAIAQYVGEMCISETGGGDVIVENGGDIFLKVSSPVTISIYAADSPLSGKVGIELKEDYTPAGVCTSSGVIGHSRSFGSAHAVTVISKNTALSDAVATAMGNLLKTHSDIEPVLEKMQNIPGVDGGLIIFDDRLGAWGNVNLVPV